ncbi:MAG: HAD-IIIC family phosphatase [Ilumatobacteraceae bacterium]
MAAGGDARATLTRWRTILRDTDQPSPRLLVVASYTAQPITEHLGVRLSETTGDVVDLSFADYNQVFQVCLDPVAHGVGDADEIVILWRLEDVFERDIHAWGNGETDATGRVVDGARSLGAAVAGLAAQIGGRVIAADAPTPIGFGLDHGDPDLVTRLTGLQWAANRAFDDGLGDAPIERLRVAALQHAVGTEATFDRRTWLMARQPNTQPFNALLGRSIADLIAARTDVPPKVIVLDCDDTLWSGVIADDGIGALQCSDAFPGFAHRSFQIAVQRLRHQGVLLAIASKNDPEPVEEAFATVDGMVLTADDIAARRVTWDPKPPGVADIAAELNVGLDSLVFVDDSDYEIGSMRTQLPDVRSLQVPSNLEALPDLLAETGWFRMMRVTDDDRVRTERMIAESGRTSAATAMSQAEFLDSLSLTVRLIRVGAGEIGRVAQLVNKTNQFNCTAIRRSEQEIAELVGSDATSVHAIAVDDRFGEYGIVGVVIAERASSADVPDGWDLDTVLMSCRVLGRGVESAMLGAVVADLRERTPGPIAARYVDSGRNHLVRELFPDHGFEPIDDDAGSSRFVLPADRRVEIPGHITVTVT